jgi:hypothetical protein
VKVLEGDTQSTKAQTEIRATAAMKRAQTAIMANGMLEKLNLDNSIKYVKINFRLGWKRAYPFRRQTPVS